MPDQQWDWTRYWFPADRRRELPGATWLPEWAPEQDGFKTLEALAESRLMVLLGDPGTGKSHEIERFKNVFQVQPDPNKSIWISGQAISSEYGLDRVWFESPKYLEWLAGDYDLWIFWDGFDQVKREVPNLEEILRHRLQEAPCERLKLWVTCRATDWQPVFGSWLGDKFLKPSTGQDEWSPYILCPLRKSDAELVARAEDIDREEFWAAYPQELVGPFGVYPLGLKWLIEIFKRGDSMPESPTELYWQGIEILAQETHGLDKLEAKPNLTPATIGRFASRIAFITAFSNRGSLWTSPNYGDVEADCLLPSQLVGGAEQVQNLELEVTDDVIRSTAKSPIFLPDGPNMVTWAHQSYWEFLAAKYCDIRSLKTDQILELLTNARDTEYKVIPGLKRVAIWLAIMREDILDALLERDPMTLIDQELAIGNDTIRAQLFEKLATGINAGSIVQYEYLPRDAYKKLSFDGLVEAARAHLLNRTLSVNARNTVIDVIEDCNLSELAPELAAIAVDNTENQFVRAKASVAVGQLQHDEAKRQLKPLLDPSFTKAFVDDRIRDTLRGATFEANWPENIDINELDAYLTKPTWDGYGVYQRFLNYGLVASCRTLEIPQLFAWFEKQSDWGSDGTINLRDIGFDLINKAMEHAEDPGIFDALVDFIVRGLETDLNDLIWRSFKYREMVIDTSLRRNLLERLVMDLGDKVFLDLVELGLPFKADFDWILSLLAYHRDDPDVLNRWIRILFWCYDHEDTSQTTRLCDFATDDYPLIKEHIDDITSGNPRVEEVRERRLRQEQESFSSILDDIRATLIEPNQGSWLKLDAYLRTYGPGRTTTGWIEPDIRAQGNWGKCPDDVRDQILTCARTYLDEREPGLSLVLTSEPHAINPAGYRALGLLLEESPDRLETISDDIWQRWGPVILGFTPKVSGEPIDFQRELLQKALEAGFDPLPALRRIAEQEAEDSDYHFRSALMAVIKNADDDQLTELAEEYLKEEWGAVKNQATISILSDEAHFEPAVQHAAEMALRMVVASETAQRGGELAASVLAAAPSKYWDTLWPPAFEKRKSREAILYSLAHYGRADRLFPYLNEEQLQQLYRDLSQHYPTTEDPEVSGAHFVSVRESIGQWRDQALSHLASRGTWRAVQCLQQLRADFPGLDWLVGPLERARGLARNKDWEPTSPEHLLTMALESNSRIVNSNQGLMDLVLESLELFSQKLQAETPIARQLWNIPTLHQRAFGSHPKDEGEIADAIKIGLDQTLGHELVILNRESTNRRGNELDIKIEAKLSGNETDIFTVVCEVKGCWHRELETAQETQLRDRYLKQNGHHYGIYIVAFCDCDHWDAENRNRRHQVSKTHTMEGLSTMLEQQSRDLSTDGLHLKSIVLDFRI